MKIEGQNANQEISQTPSEPTSPNAAPQVEQTPQAPAEPAPHPIASKDPVTKRHQKSAREFAQEQLDKLQADPKKPTVGESINMDDPSGEKAAQEAAEADAQANKYTPNYKLKVLDKELEIPETFRGLMKDEKSEKEVREIFEKAYGLEPVKQQRDQYKNKLKEVEPQLMGIQSQIAEARQMYQKGDMKGFFKTLNVAPEKVLQYALELIQYEEMTPEQKRLVDANEAAQEQARNLAKQNQELTQNYMTQVQQANALALDTALARADIKAIADAFDARPGRNPEDTFRNMVIDYADWIWQQSQGKTVLTAEQAVQGFISRFGLSAGPQTTPAQAPATPPVAQQPAATQPAPQAPAQPKVPVIPNVSGRASASPTKAKPRSLDDLKKLREQMA